VKFSAASLLLLLSWPVTCPAAALSPREILASLNALSPDSQNVYTLSAQDRIEIRHGDVVLSFQEGRFAFYTPFEGRVTGFVFSGLGHVLSLPHDPSEKQQMARFLGAPVLDQQFVSAYIRFTDDTASNLLAQFQHAGLNPSPNPSFVAAWEPNVTRLNPTHSFRILLEIFSSAPRHFFHAGIDGVITGPFDVLADDLRPENLMIGQPRTVNKTTSYDVWTSHSLPGFSPTPLDFTALRYHINTTINSDNSLDGNTSVDFRSLTGAAQFLFFQLARTLKVASISLDSATPLTFFQNEGLTGKELRYRGEDSLCVFLPNPLPPGAAFTLNFSYRGDVIENAGNAVLYVGERDSWFPHHGDTSEFSVYDMTLRWPKRLRLVATGEKSQERDDGEFRVAHWQTEQPVTEAGFNLGEYAVASVASENHSIDVYANKQLEAAILSQLAQSSIQITPAFPFPGADSAARISAPPPPPSPAEALKRLAHDIDSSVHFLEQYSGPFPFRHLAVSQIPGSFGQGWPGLLYISTYSFLSPEAQRRAGLNSNAQEFFTQVVPFHEAAHQWWGNVVGWSSYRDQWINEAIANYLAMLFADSGKNPDHILHVWLDRDRKRLLTKDAGEDLPPVETGSLIMGLRLFSSRSASAYDEVIYGKGAWIMHMLREMLCQPNSQNPDARFMALLKSLVVKYARKPLSTAQFQREVEAVMTPKMDIEGGRSMEWFFDEYVRGTAIPHYTVSFTSRRVEKGFQVRGKLVATGVPHSFVAPVPLYASSGSGHNVFLGTVIAGPDETHFSFTTQTEPRKLLIDPQMTLLCVPE
jgi:Peptidase family M1 domain